MGAPPPLADLHTHTLASDGSLSSEQLVTRAAGRRVAVLALTDHDTLDGLPAALAAGERYGVRVVPGVELSVRVPTGTMHLLGYFEEPSPPVLGARLAELRDRRRQRAAQIVAKLRDLGAPVEMPAVLARASGSVGRPHIADELVAAGHVTGRQDAFDRYLGDGGPAWVPSDGLTPPEAIALIRSAGGASSLAHPASLRLDAERLASFVGRLAAQGLDGIEVHRPEHSPDRRRRLQELARRFDLVATGGSDFHHPGGPSEPGDTGSPPLPADALDRLLAHRTT